MAVQRGALKHGQSGAADKAPGKGGGIVWNPQVVPPANYGETSMASELGGPVDGSTFAGTSIAVHNANHSGKHGLGDSLALVPLSSGPKLLPPRGGALGAVKRRLARPLHAVSKARKRRLCRPPALRLPFALPAAPPVQPSICAVVSRTLPLHPDIRILSRSLAS